MFSDSTFATIVFGLASAITYGIGDFGAGYASRRTTVLMVLLLSQGVGLVALFVLALVFGENAISTVDLLYGIAAGLAGLVGVLGLYRGLAMGQMSIVAPITAVLATALPVLFSAVTDTLPTLLQMAGFLLAVIGVYLISRPPSDKARPSLTSLGLAFIGGFSFGIFFILLGQIQEEVVFLPLVAARFASLSVIIAFAFLRRGFARPDSKALPIIIFAGVMDAAGNALFVLAEQSGRLDIASVLASLYPVATVILALVLLKEQLTRWQIGGILLVFLALPLIA